MKRVIILEGPDNIGKSYLATALTNELIDAGYKHTKLRHFGPPTKKGLEILQEQLDVLNHEANEMHRHEHIEIWDRSVIGEAVYGPLYRAGAYDEKVYWDELVDFCRAFQILFAGDSASPACSSSLTLAIFRSSRFAAL